MTMNRLKCVMVIGGAGYIGSHCVLQLLEKGHNVLVIDNLRGCVSPDKQVTLPEPLQRVEKLTGKTVYFEVCDICDKPDLNDIFLKYDVQCVVHLAALKAIRESVEKPLWYYKNNLLGFLTLLEVMTDHKVHNFILSSTYTVYGDEVELPAHESYQTGMVKNPYAMGKHMQEVILKDMCKAFKHWNMIVFRVTNPGGAHPSGDIGEHYAGSLMSFVANVVVGKKPQMQIFGDKYDTVDGTATRDYIHIMDAADAFEKGVSYLLNKPNSGYNVFNLGTGVGITVMQVIQAFERCTGKKVPYKIEPQRPCDLARAFCDPTAIKQTLGWEPARSLDDMCIDTMKWARKNPNGYPPMPFAPCLPQAIVHTSAMPKMVGAV